MAASMSGKVALVTGAGSGIGRATAYRFAREGARVVVADIVVEGGQATADKICRDGGEAVFVKADVSKSGEVAELVHTAVARFGRLDFAHNNAGIEGAQFPTADYPEDAFDKVISINLKGVWLCMKYEIPVMLKQGKGAIVNTSSVAGLAGFAGLTAYTASKHAVAGMTKVAALEYAKQGLRINAVCPGVIRTPMIDRFLGGSKEAEAAFTALEPVGRFGEPEEIAEAVVWLCSDAASFVTGLPMPVDGAFIAQ